MKKAIVLLAEGFEEIEAVTPVDYLRRTGSIEVTIASISGNLNVKSSRGISLIADVLIANIENPTDYDAVILPGGLKGAENIASCEKAGDLIKSMAAAGKLICAVCASPAIALSPLGILDGKRFTCYPGMEEKVKNGKWSQDRVVTDGNIITSRSAGTSGEFAIAIIESLIGKEAGRKIAESVLL